MTLDLAAVGRAAADMGRVLADVERQEQDHLERALAALRDVGADIAPLHQKLEGAGFAGLVARPVEALDRRAGLPPVPSDYAVVATDGSLIEPDRHGAAYYYLINIGTVLLRYGAAPFAQLKSSPTLGYRPEDLYLTLAEREVPLQGGVLRMKRAVAETEYLAAVLLRSRETPLPLIGLQDGTLILWMPEGREEDELRDALVRPFLAALDRLKADGLPAASYISRPRASEVVNLLRVALCPFAKADCRQNCPRRSQRQPASCDVVEGVTDRRLFEGLGLKSGERSALFAHSSRIMKQYGDHQVYFFYLNVGSEIARVEVPEWVALDRAKRDAVQAIVYDQARRGAGYPRALTEAHEKAVVGVQEREQCERMIETVLQRHHVRQQPSEKQRSKKLRAV